MGQVLSMQTSFIINFLVSKHCRTCNLKLDKIDFEQVSADCLDEPYSSFNTAFHEIDPETKYAKPPLEAPYSFGRWLPTILKTRDLDPSFVQAVRLTQAQARLFLTASTTSIITGELNRAFEEDLREEFFPCFSSLTYPPEGLFMRLDGCSPKDGRQRRPGVSSLHCMEDIVLRLTTSQRAHNDIRNSLRSNPITLDIFFLPFDHSMAPDHEYRVYCSPGKGAITAIGQYRWHQPWALSTMPETHRQMHLENIWSGVSSIHRQIHYALSPHLPEDVLLLRQGFSFDVFYNIDTGQSELVELNVFGATSGCGSCLFHWLNDSKLLYGDGSEIEARVTW